MQVFAATSLPSRASTLRACCSRVQALALGRLLGTRGASSAGRPLQPHAAKHVQRRTSGRARAAEAPPAAPEPALGSSGSDSDGEEVTEDAGQAGGSDQPALSKAEARKARRTPPSVIPPPTLPAFEGGALGAALSNGALLIDKPQDWTSFDVCGKLRNTLKFLGVKKVGHAGTLDPMATGLLVVATGAGTKFCDDFMALAKEYSGTIRLGEATPSYDAETEVSERAAWEHITDEDLQRVAATFLGDSMQVPPMYSAIKVGGQKLYNLAREGTTIDRAARPITVTAFRVWRDQQPGSSGDSSNSTHASASSPAAAPGDGASAEQEANGAAGEQAAESSSRSVGAPGQDVHFWVACSKGTYIRSIAHDFGQKLGTLAHLTALRRESIGELKVTEAWDLQELITQLQAAREAAGGGAPPPKRQRPGPRKRKDAPPAPAAEADAQQAAPAAAGEGAAQGPPGDGLA